MTNVVDLLFRFRVTWYEGDGKKQWSGCARTQEEALLRASLMKDRNLPATGVSVIRWGKK